MHSNIACAKGGRRLSRHQRHTPFWVHWYNCHNAYTEPMGEYTVSRHGSWLGNIFCVDHLDGSSTVYDTVYPFPAESNQRGVCHV
jgi:hypothetical protein